MAEVVTEASSLQPHNFPSHRSVPAMKQREADRVHGLVVGHAQARGERWRNAGKPWSTYRAQAGSSYGTEMAAEPTAQKAHKAQKSEYDKGECE